MHFLLYILNVVCHKTAISNCRAPSCARLDGRAQLWIAGHRAFTPIHAFKLRLTLYLAFANRATEYIAARTAGRQAVGTHLRCSHPLIVPHNQ